jgi:hypothetical protein
MQEQDPKKRRLTEVLEDYWNEKKQGREFPSLGDIDINDLPPEIRQDCFILEVNPSPTGSNNYAIQYLGDNLNSKYMENSGVYIKHVIVRFLETPADHYLHVIESKEPYSQNVELERQDGGRIKYRQIFLPLGPDDDKPITAILGGMRFVNK